VLLRSEAQIINIPAPSTHSRRRRRRRVFTKFPYCLSIQSAAHRLDLWAKAACNLWETLKDPEAGFSNKAIDSTWHRTLGINVPFHRWLEQPPQRKLRTLFDIAIKGDFPLRGQRAHLSFWSGYAEMNPPSTILDGGSG
jgi:hypothetical protein